MLTVRSIGDYSPHEVPEVDCGSLALPIVKGRATKPQSIVFKEPNQNSTL